MGSKLRIEFYYRSCKHPDIAGTIAADTEGNHIDIGETRAKVIDKIQHLDPSSGFELTPIDVTIVEDDFPTWLGLLIISGVLIISSGLWEIFRVGWLALWGK